MSGGSLDGTVRAWNSSCSRQRTMHRRNLLAVRVRVKHLKTSLRPNIA